MNYLISFLKAKIAGSNAFLRVSLASFFALLSVASFAQQPIVGTLLDDKSSEPVPFVNIALLRAMDSVFVCGATTNEQGKFSIDYSSKVPEALRPYADMIPMLLRISSIGYKTVYYPVPTPHEQPLEIRMTKGATTLDEVVITAERPLYAIDGEKTLYNVKDDPSLQSGTASDALQNAPGVEVDAEGNITLHGTESVSIWINDRPSHLTAEGLKQYIKNLPADAIDRIEVIANPSARYGGGGAVVNIITQTKVKRNEFFSFGGDGSTLPSAMGWLSYVYANDKFSINVFANGGYNRSHSESTSNGDSYDSNGQLSEHNESESEYENRMRHTGIFVSGSYTFDTMNDLSFWTGIYANWSKSESDLEQTRTEYLFNPGEYHFSDLSHGKNNALGGYMGVNYTHKFNNEGHRLDLSFNGNLYDFQSPSSMLRSYDLFPAMNFTDTTMDKGNSLSWSFEANYVRPFAEKWEWELGMETSGSPLERDRSREVLQLDGSWLNDALRSYGTEGNSFNLQGYTTLLRRFGNFTAKVGVRAAYESLGQNYTDVASCNFHNEFFYLIPSLHLSYRTDNMHNFNFSYTLRRTTPSADNLSPHPMYGIDSYSSGNPDLQCTYTHHLTAGWTKFFMKFGSVGLEALYKFEQNGISSLADVAYNDIYGRIVAFSQPINIGSSGYGGIDANVMWRPTPFSNIRLQAGVFNYHYNVQFRPGEWSEDGMWNARVRLNGWAKVWKIINVFGNISYTSPTLGLMTEEGDNFNVTLGASADLFKRRLSLYVFINNLFDSNNDYSTSRNPYATGVSSTIYHDRMINFGISLRFGKLELESRARTGSMQGM